MKTHWLFGRGPDKLLDFKREIDEETDCSKCIHREVCGLDMEKRCENYVFGTSEGRGCQGCVHKHTRYDKDSVPCFSCPWFEEKKEASVLATYLPMDCPICGRRRLELIDGGKIVRCEKCMTSSKWEGFSVQGYVMAANDILQVCVANAKANETRPSMPRDLPNEDLVGRRFRPLKQFKKPGRIAVVVRVDPSDTGCGVRLGYRYEDGPPKAQQYVSQRWFLMNFVALGGDRDFTEVTPSTEKP